MFGLWAGQGLKSRRNTFFVELSLLWWWNSTYQNLKGWPFQKCELQSFAFQKKPILQRPQVNQLGGFEYNLRCLKRFFRKVLRKLWSASFLKLRFLKIRLLVTWLKCLIYTFLKNRCMKIVQDSCFLVSFPRFLRTLF